MRVVNLFSGDLEPTIGSVTRAGKLRMAHFNQHSVDAVKDLTQNSVEYLQKLFPGTPVQAVRSHLGKFGLVGDSTLLPIGLLSGGQRSRLVLARMAWREPHVYLLDEPTNHRTRFAPPYIFSAVCVFEKSGGLSTFRITLFIF